MRRNPSSYDIARKAGVSQTTVSFVLNERADMPISPATRERVLAAARELGYRPNSLARSLVRGTTQTIGVVVPRLDSSFSASIVQGIQEALDQHGFSVLLSHTRHRAEDEAKQIDLLLEHRVDGVVCLCDEQTIDSTPVWLDELVAQHRACVLVDDRTHVDRVDCVVSDDRQGAQEVVRHLLGQGHRRIAHLSAGDRVSSARDRRDGYLAGLAATGISPDGYLVFGVGFESDRWEDRIAGFLDRLDHPSAVFAANDHIAALTIEAAQARGLKVPDDLAVVGYGDYAMGRFLHLSTVDQDPIGMGRAAALRLLRRLKEPALPPEGLVLPCRLVIRGSSRARSV